MSKKTNKNEIEQKIINLSKELNKYSRSYYLNSKPLVEDSYYDQKLKELENLEQKYPYFIQKNSPTKRVGFKVLSSLEKIKHEVKMLSLQNALNKEELKDFLQRVSKNIKEADKLEYVLEPKIDGVSISLIYEKGNLKQALTRGDGNIGENVIHNIELMNDVPKKINYQKKIIVRGEIFSTLSNFQKINNLSEKKYANPRNFASGSIRLLDSKEFSSRNLNAFFYQIYFLEEENKFEKHSQIYDFLKNNNFSYFDKYQLTTSKNLFEEEIVFYTNLRKKIDFEMDGIAIKVNNYSIQNMLGETIKFPKWAIAYKFAPEIGYTKLLDIFPTVGRTGLIVYNAKLEPINLLNTTVQYATLHNLEYIKDLDLRIGDFVYVKKSGEIIPKLIKPDLNVRPKNLKKWVELKKCPECNSELVFSDTLNNQFCINENCKGKIKAKLIHYASKQAMDYNSLGEKNIIKFFNWGILNSIEDFYLLKNKKDFLLSQEGFKEKSVNKIIASIEKSKNLSLENLLYGLGILNIGFKSSLDLAKKFQNLENILNLSEEDFNNLNDFGEVKAKSLFDYFSNSKNKELISFLKQNNQNFEFLNQNQNIDLNNKFYMKNVVVSGTFEDVNRTKAEQILISKGAIVKKAISSKIDYLIIGEKPSESKVKKMSQEKIIQTNIFNDIFN